MRHSPLGEARRDSALPARAHDAATFEITREEAAGHGTPGTTKRFDPITPFLTFVLLTGMRFSEAVNATWDQVDLDAGEVNLRGEKTKTKQARTVDLSVSPAVHELLTKLQRKDGHALVVPAVR